MQKILEDDNIKIEIITAALLRNLWLYEPFLLFLHLVAGSALEDGSICVKCVMGALIFASEVLTALPVLVLANEDCEDDRGHEDEGEDGS